jgi:hypothetical protein
VIARIKSLAAKWWSRFASRFKSKTQESPEPLILPPPVMPSPVVETREPEPAPVQATEPVPPVVPAGEPATEPSELETKLVQLTALLLASEQRAARMEQIRSGSCNEHIPPADCRVSKPVDSRVSGPHKNSRAPR